MDAFTIDPKTGRVPAPAQVPVITPEQEAQAAAKLAAGRALRAERRASGELPATYEPVATSEALAIATEGDVTPDANTVPEPSPEPSRALPWKKGDPGLETKPAPAISADEQAKVRLILDNEAYITQHGMSRKMVERKAQEARELEASERNAAEAERTAPPLPTDEEIETARAAYEAADALVTALRLELAGLPDKITDAVKTGQLAHLPELRQRQRDLPDEIDAARVGAAQALIVYRQTQPAHTKAAHLAARRKSAASQEAFREWQAKVNASINAEADAQSDHREAVLSVGAAMNALDALIEELAHRHQPRQGYKPLT